MKNIKNFGKYFVSSNNYKAKDKHIQYVKKAQFPKVDKINIVAKQLIKEQYDGSYMKQSMEDTIKSTNPLNIYKKMDTSIEGFFQKRSYTIKNFNFLLQIQSEKRDIEGAEKTFELMKAMDIKADPYTYNNMIKVYSKSLKLEKAEYYFDKALQCIFLKKKNIIYYIQEFGANLHLYTSLLLGYARKGDAKEAERIIREMKEKGLQLDSAAYTTLINGFYKSQNLTKCWETYNDLQKNNKQLLDIPIISFMIEIAAHVNNLIYIFFYKKKTKDAEKGKMLWNKLEQFPNFYPTTIHYNNIIKCLGSRKDYADEAIEFWEKMKITGINPDQDTFVHLFKACDNAGDVKTAYDAIQIMKNNNIQLNQYILNSSLKVYSGAIKTDLMTSELIDIYLNDSWKIFEKAKELNMVNVYIINSLLYVHVAAIKDDKIDGLVLPLYDQYGIKKNEKTYELLMELYFQKKDLKQIYRLHGWMKAEGLKENWQILNYVMDAAYRSSDVQVMGEMLDKFQEIKKEPRQVFLKKLGQAKYLPDELYIKLKKFKTQFGFVQNKNYKKVDLFKKLRGKILQTSKKTP
ncbi:pentatricopeptide repeat domain protein [Ichthyophthirius multifiliis]|uniref:Pentatricopeptide repeat domain protein n=1 Tax=Ichthyophthirius multifiliis TaxID=5932 RepID=G0QLE0_ICHMU|nr:pentatricopeptide repeat domain protein [Ichthyophthirius multifiliis]EGR33964.1 pentatricopeptide repeat domain protein [Ichthyophthirius multifiliis]|eukprot:XP_004039268.1 pentatricopeptide repeat domain protein [Ichthyophthirius multifiliis]